MKLTGWPVELSKQWEEMVVSKGWQVGGQHNHGYEDERQENHGGGKMGGKAAKGSLRRMEGKEKLGGREQDWPWQIGGLVRRSLSSKMHN